MRRFKTTIKFSTNFVNNTVIAGNKEKRREQGINQHIKLLPCIMFETCLKSFPEQEPEQRANQRELRRCPGGIGHTHADTRSPQLVLNHISQALPLRRSHACVQNEPAVNVAAEWPLKGTPGGSRPFHPSHLQSNSAGKTMCNVHCYSFLA